MTSADKIFIVFNYLQNAGPRHAGTRIPPENITATLQTSPRPIADCKLRPIPHPLASLDPRLIQLDRHLPIVEHLQQHAHTLAAA